MISLAGSTAIRETQEYIPLCGWWAKFAASGRSAIPLESACQKTGPHGRTVFWGWLALFARQSLQKWKKNETAGESSSWSDSNTAYTKPFWILSVNLNCGNFVVGWWLLWVGSKETRCMIWLDFKILGPNCSLDIYGADPPLPCLKGPQMPL